MLPRAGPRGDDRRRRERPRAWRPRAAASGARGFRGPAERSRREAVWFGAESEGDFTDEHQRHWPRRSRRAVDDDALRRDHHCETVAPAPRDRRSSRSLDPTEVDGRGAPSRSSTRRPRPDKRTQVPRGRARPRRRPASTSPPRLRRTQCRQRVRGPRRDPRELGVDGLGPARPSAPRPCGPSPARSARAPRPRGPRGPARPGRDRRSRSPRRIPCGPGRSAGCASPSRARR